MHPVMLRSSKAMLFALSWTIPASSFALGLGDIQVESALNEPLRAQIELVGVTSDEMAELTARVASEEVFRRYGLDRPAFLSGITLTAGNTPQGRPVLVLHSNLNISAPLVTLLVDLQSREGELIRQYDILLDPPRLVSQPSQVALGQTAPAPAKAQSPAVTSPAAPGTSAAHLSPGPPRGRAPAVAAAQSSVGMHPPPRTYTVARGDTLDRIVRSAGAHRGSDHRRMAIAIFRANPSAFRANLNRLRIGATLHLPSREQMSAVSIEDANREYATQMAAWHASVRRISPAARAGKASMDHSTAVTERHAGTTARAQWDETETRLLNLRLQAAEADSQLLAQRVSSLETSLHALQQQLRKPLEIPPVRPAVSMTKPDASATAGDHAASLRRALRFAPLTLGMGLLLAAAIWYRRAHLTRASSTVPNPGQDSPAEPRREQADATEVLPSPPQDALSSPMPASAVSEPKDPFGSAAAVQPDVSAARESVIDPTVRLAAPRQLEVDDTATLPTAEPAENETGKFACFNPDDLANTTHVVINSEPGAARPFVERRKNPADVLRQAIEREPHRSDLRLRLLELYYVAVAENRRAFLDAVAQLAKNEGLATAQDWARIMDMARAIAPDDPRFSSDTNDRAVA